MRKRIVSGVLAGAAGLLILPGMAAAQSQAYTNSPVNLYAGPAQDYPVVSQLPGGAPVAVFGCVAGYTWCDVALQDQRGWVYAGYLNYPYQGNNVPLLSYGTAIGLPIVTFSIGAYWGSYYRGRPWYNNQAHWEHHPPPGPPPGHGGPPNGHGGPPPGHGGPPPGHGGPPQGHGGPPQQQQHGGPPQGHGGPPQQQQHGGPPPGHGGPPQQQQQHGGPPQGHGGPPQQQQQQHGGPPQQHGGPPSGGHGGGGDSGHGGHEEHHN